MKSYTDLEQSKKLAEILPIESADMHWQYIEEDNGQLQWFCFPKDFSINQHNMVLAWSLAALMNVLPYPSLAQHASGLWSLVAWVDKAEAYSVGDSVRGYDNEIDACVAMIEKLHEEKLL